MQFVDILICISGLFRLEDTPDFTADIPTSSKIKGGGAKPSQRSHPFKTSFNCIQLHGRQTLGVECKGVLSNWV